LTGKKDLVRRFYNCKQFEIHKSYHFFTMQ